MEIIKQFLKKNKIFAPAYKFLKSIKDNNHNNHCFRYKGTFINHSKGYDNLCIILSGYKEFLFDIVFERISKFQKEDMDICVVSSGLFSDKLVNICEKYGWSYLSTRVNNVGLVQNVAIKLHPNAKFIFKLDEDIFITENYFDNMLQAYGHAIKGDFIPGVVAPLITINGYGHLRILKKLGLDGEYSNRFETPKYAAGSERQIESNPEVAKFMWGEGGCVPSIDEINKKFSNQNKIELACPVRFSIGAILFERKLWENMGYFDVKEGMKGGLGSDEEKICRYCYLNSRPVMVSENVVVGHLSFGSQNNEMRKYYEENKEKFYI